MKHVLFEDPVTHKFTLIPLPRTFREGDRLPPPVDRWFETREAAVATLAELFNLED